jgi:hypothetical protein
MRILCTLPNASGETNGIKFERHARGMLSEELDIDNEVAKVLLTVPGFAPLEEPQAAAVAVETKAYSDGTTATGPAPLPEQSPAQQDAAAAESAADAPADAAAAEQPAEQPAAEEKPVAAASKKSAQGKK